MSKLFEQEYKDISLHKTYELSKGLKSIREKEIYSTLNENINEKNKDPLYLDEKEDIFSKNPFQEKYENKERDDGVKIDKSLTRYGK